MIRLTFTIALIFNTIFSYSQARLIDYKANCDENFIDNGKAINKYIESSSFSADTFCVIIVDYLNCGYEKSMSDFKLDGTRLFIENFIKKEVVDSVGNVSLFMAPELDCDCKFYFHFRFIGLDRLINYEIIYNKEPIKLLENNTTR